MKTELNIRMAEGTTFDEINRLMQKYKLSGGYGYTESILSRDKNFLILRCHFKDDRMNLRDILKKLDELATEETIFLSKVEITER